MRAFLLLLIIVAVLSQECRDEICRQQIGGGYCVGNTCNCLAGWYRVNGDCVGGDHLAPASFLVLQILIGIIYSVLSIMSLGVLLLLWKKKSKHLNISAVVTITILLNSLSLVAFFSVDPFLTKGIYPSWVKDILLLGALNGQLSIYLMIVVHWLELHSTILRRLKKEEMLSKINQQNKKYKEESTTFEEVEEKLAVINRGRTPFFALTGVAFILFLIFVIVQNTGNPAIAAYAYYAWVAYFAAMFIAIFIAFIVIAKRFSKVVHRNLYKRLKKATRRTAILTVVAGIAEAFGALAYFLGSPNAVFSALLLAAVIVSGLHWTMLVAFIMDHKLYRLIPLKNCRSADPNATSSSNPSNPTPTPS